MPPIFLREWNAKAEKWKERKVERLQVTWLQKTDSSSWFRKYIYNRSFSRRKAGFNLSASRPDFLLPHQPPPPFPSFLQTSLHAPLDSSRPKDNQLIKTFTQKPPSYFYSVEQSRPKTCNIFMSLNIVQRVIDTIFIYIINYLQHLKNQKFSTFL